MAKKKTAASRPPAAKKRTPPKKSNLPAKATAVKMASHFGCEAIGSVAGLVWQTLSNDGEQTAAALKKSVAAPGDLVMAAVGWLAREEKLTFDTSGRTVKISLR